jgi:hypothetical protein
MMTCNSLSLNAASGGPVVYALDDTRLIMKHIQNGTCQHNAAILREMRVLVLLSPPQIPHGLKVDRDEKTRDGNLSHITALVGWLVGWLVGYLVVYLYCDILAFVGRMFI